MFLAFVMTSYVAVYIDHGSRVVLDVYISKSIHRNCRLIWNRVLLRSLDSGREDVILNRTATPRRVIRYSVMRHDTTFRGLSAELPRDNWFRGFLGDKVRLLS